MTFFMLTINKFGLNFEDKKWYSQPFKEGFLCSKYYLGLIHPEVPIISFNFQLDSYNLKICNQVLVFYKIL